MAKEEINTPPNLYVDLQTNSNVEIGKSALGGRGLFATQFLKRGTLLFVNKPTVYGPRANCDVKKFCSNCYQISDLCYPCEKCHAFVCCVCNDSTDHTLLCTFICCNWKLKNNCETNVEIAARLALALIYLKFLVLSEEEKELLNLFQKTQRSDQFEELEALEAVYFIPEPHIEFMNNVKSILKINSFRISRNLKSKTIELRGLYPLSAFMNHNCIPNTRNSFTSDYSMAVYASKDIDRGEEITSCYTGLLWCSPARRCQLYKSKNFWCKCTRCSDRTEMGTGLSALKCLNKPCIGMLLPKNPLNPQTEWVCDSCNVLIPPKKINMMQSLLGSLVGSLRLDDEFCMESCILKRLGIFIPLSNHIFVDIQLRLALKIGYKDDVNINGIIKRTH